MPSVAGVEHSWRRVGDVDLHVAEAGHGPPLVMLHGWPQHWYQWRRLIGPLSKRHRVICPDLRGFGWSSVPRSGYDRETLARDVLGLMDAMGIDDFELVGHDWGGWVGFLLALRRPERVRRFLVLNIASPRPDMSPAAVATLWRFWYQWLLAAPLLGARSVRALRDARGPLPGWTGARRAWNEHERRVFLDQFRDEERVRASVALYRDFLLADVPRVVGGRYYRHRLQPPTLMLYGTGDHVIRPAHFGGHERWADRMTVERIEGCGHFVVDERPELVVERALSFFSPNGG